MLLFLVVALRQTISNYSYNTRTDHQGVFNRLINQYCNDLTLLSQHKH